MNMGNVMNVLLCVEDRNWNYTRHCAVTILSLLESNSNSRIKFYIMSSWLPEENIKELKRIVRKYNQEIEFIIHDDIIPKNIKNKFINRLNLPFGTYYRLFLSQYITSIDRLLYLDCDVLIKNDISEIYNMDMRWKAIAWYYDIDMIRFISEYNFDSKQFINAWVLLIDVKKFSKYKITEKLIENINNKYGKYQYSSDQDYINIIFKDDIYVYKKSMNYLITSKFFNAWLSDAKIVHCLNKPYVQYRNIPKNLVKLYNNLLNLTKWKWYPEERANYWYPKHIFLLIRNFFFTWMMCLLWDREKRKIFYYLYRFLRKNKIKEK